MILFTMLQAAAPAQQGGSQLSFWIMIILVFAVMWFFMIRPQRKQQKEIEKFRKELKKGDKVVTAGGIYGTILEVQERTVLLKVDKDVKLRVDKTSLLKDYSEAAAAAATDSKGSSKNESKEAKVETIEAPAETTDKE